MKSQADGFGVSGDTCTTSALISGRERVRRLPAIALSGALSVWGTSSTANEGGWVQPNPEGIGTPRQATQAASAHASATQDREAIGTQREATRKGLTELRRISGLSWEQLGQLFAVPRRSVQFWASGRPLDAVHEERLLRLLGVVRTVDRGDTPATRSALVDASDGTSVFELLVEGRLDEARARLGVGAKRRSVVLGELSAEAKAARAPLRPEELIEARHDRVHQDPGGVHATSTVRNSRRGST